MNLKFILVLFSAFSGAHLSAQTVRFESVADSSSVAVKAVVLVNDKRGNTLTGNAGTIDFSGTPQGAYIEVSAEGFQEKVFPYSDQLPPVIRLRPVAQRIDEVVVTGQMQQTSIGNAVQTVRTISSKKIEQMGAQNLTQLFRNELNIQLSNDAILGTGMSLQGISGENIKLLIDGVPVIGRLNGTIDLDQINLNNVERIEIIEGPLSVNYGSDALAGTINIITKKHSKSAFQSKATAFYESNGTYNTQLTLSTQLKKTMITADVNRNYFDGWRPNEADFHIEQERIADTLRTKVYKPREQLFGGLKIQQQLYQNAKGNPLYLTLQSRLFSEEILNRGTPLKPYYLKAFDEYYNTLRFDNSLALNGAIGTKWSINSTNAYNFFQRRKNTFLNDLTTLTETLTPAASDQDTSVFDLVLSRSSFIYAHSSNWQLEAGYDINYESSRGLRIEGLEKAIGDYAVFLTSEITPVKKLTLKPGVRASYNSAYKSPIIPSLFVKYQITPKNGIRASYSRGFRAPSLKELYFYFVDINHNIQGNSDLEAETSDNYQLALRTDYERGKCRLVITNQFFYNDLNNLITLAQVSATEYSYVNLSNSQTYGYALNSTFTRKGFALEAGATVKGRRSQVSEDESPRTASFYPEYKINPSYQFKDRRTTLAFYYKFTGKIPNFVVDDSGAIVETKRASFSMLDATLTTLLWKGRIGITTGIKNIFDITTINGMVSGGAHESGSGSVQIGMGRTYFCSLSIQLNTKKNER